MIVFTVNEHKNICIAGLNRQAGYATDCIQSRNYTDTQETKEYIGITAGPFKDRYNNHKKSLTHAKYAKETELSKYAWNLKETGRPFTIKWCIIKCVPAYTAGGRSCNLCLEEKLLIMKSSKEKTLNKRSELFAKRRHRKKFGALNFKSAHAYSSNLNLNLNRKRK